MINQDLQSQLRNLGYTGKFDLSELMEACGEHFCILQTKLTDNPNEKYRAGTFNGIGVCYGKTPKEAVAKLWLELAGYPQEDQHGNPNSWLDLRDNSYDPTLIEACSNDEKQIYFERLKLWLEINKR